ncbi:MAG: hypothetical protein E7364_04565 [Clostridiales bacterium]|nr:hypothetical protein [Clostridiales bacterium]
MQFPKKFICASEEKNRYENHICAPYFRKIFTLSEKKNAKLLVCGLGFYRAFLNDKEITKGRLAPYISNTGEEVYYDVYQVDKFVKKGKNTLTILLGNGLQNGIGGELWGFDKEPWTSSPKLAVAFSLREKLIFETDETFEWCPSPITFDDLWAGEHYDARLEGESKWQRPLLTETPKGERRDASAYQVRVKKELSPKTIFPYQNGYIYDFGLNTAGVCRLRFNGKAGQKVSLYHFEIFDNGEICKDNISFGKRTRDGYWQMDEYTAKDGKNVYEPSFTYHGFRYVYVEGLTKKQAKKSALTMLVMTAATKPTLQFSCSDKRLEQLFAMVVNSNQSNFFYYPTDCPHREKNGWTGDARLSAEQMLLSADYGEYLKEWLFCMRKAQRENGDLPRIIPTCEWGYAGGHSGPCWDGALVEIAYRLYKKHNDKEILKENLPAIKKYLTYLTTRCDEKGLLAFGLGDREETFTNESSAHKTPNVVTDTLTAIGLCQQTEEMANEIADTEIVALAKTLKERLIIAVKEHLVDDAQRVMPFTQTGQCLLVSAEIFEGEKQERAFQNFVALLKKDGVVKMGVLGYRKLFEVLAERGETELASRLLLTENYSGYYYYVNKGMTSMPESFLDYETDSFVRKDGGKMLGLNHHWYGHILASVIKYVVGLRMIDGQKKRIEIAPHFLKGINNISAFLDYAGEKIKLSWQKKRGRYVLDVKTAYAVVLHTDVDDYRLSKEKNTSRGNRYVYEGK